MEDAKKVEMGIVYLDSTAMVWWRRKNVDIERGTCKINTWAQFKRELKCQFYLLSGKDEPRASPTQGKHPRLCEGVHQSALGDTGLLGKRGTLCFHGWVAKMDKEKDLMFVGSRPCHSNRHCQVTHRSAKA